ncbi:hypothetical protein EJ063_04400 [Vibrio aquaticus]|uniref:Uncharacterized protein n=1 Tax=Vibrio aquaticus TaxID=2496559 RepID=A0A3S0MLT3_9VIBR|nr:MalM family protein [Vibrio aquaticus]RTZ18036.1 hypothetical protein EJ063_04400 [Vibrio aquaticus]
MKHLVLGCAITMALFGCTTTETVVFDAPTNQQVASSYAQVDWVEIEPSKRVNFSIDQSNQQYQLTSGLGPIAAFSINTQGKEVELEIISHFKKSVFYPNAVLLNDDNQILKTFTDSDFEYKHAYGLDGDRLTAEITIQPVGKQKVKLLVYTTDALLKGESEVLHPVKLDAIARGNYPPDVPNPVIPHAQYGELSLIVKADSAVVVEEPAIVSSTDMAQQKLDADLAKLSDENAEVMTVQVGAKGESESLSAQQQQFYLTSIEHAVNVGMLDKALALLEEAKMLEVDGAQQAFIKAVNARTH